MGYGPILSIIHTVSIDKMLNKNGVNNGYELNSFRCKQGLNRISYVDSCYRPQTTLRKGNVFTSVCQEFCPLGGGCIPACTGRGDVYPSIHWVWVWQNPPADTPQADNPLGRYFPRHTPPWADTPPPTATAADGTHPTGMRSCFLCREQSTLPWNLELKGNLTSIRVRLGNMRNLIRLRSPTKLLKFT